MNKYHSLKLDISCAFGHRLLGVSSVRALMLNGNGVINPWLAVDQETMAEVSHES